MIDPSLRNLSGQRTARTGACSRRYHFPIRCRRLYRSSSPKPGWQYVPLWEPWRISDSLLAWCAGAPEHRKLLGIVEDHESPMGLRFEAETVINVRAGKAALTVWEVPSYECRRIHGESNLNAARDGSRVLRTIWRESPWRYARFVNLLAAPDRGTSGLLPTATGRGQQSVVSTLSWRVHLDPLTDAAVNDSQQAMSVPLTILTDGHGNKHNGVTAAQQGFEK
jgi:hypothetical protein